ncbi:MAG: hypothetical protein QW404_01375 [Candidatus Nanoarchaeia archaeon]
MDFMIVVWVVAALLLSFIILKLLQKTFKFLAFLVIFVVVFGILYFGYDALLGKVKDAGKEALDLKTATEQPQQHSLGCTSDSDCGFVTSIGDCNLVENSCNNIRDSSKFFKPGTKIKCSIDSVVVSPEVKCTCKKTSSGSFCEKL